MIWTGSQMTLSLWARTGTSPAGFRCMNQGSLCSLSGRLTSYSSHRRPFSAMARRTDRKATVTDLVHVFGRCSLTSVSMLLSACWFYSLKLLSARVSEKSLLQLCYCGIHSQLWKLIYLSEWLMFVCDSNPYHFNK